MNTRCLIVDDEPLAIQLLESHIAQLPELEVAATSSNAMEAMGILKTERIDLLFLDIQMPMITGVEFLRSVSNPPKVIFTTAYREYAVEGYELDVVDYLLKPITFERFFKAINKYLDQTSPQQVLSDQIVENEEGHLFVNVNKKNVKVVFNKVLYVESIKDYIKIHLEDETLVTKEKISDFEVKLPISFLRVHRSYIVNKSKIDAFTAADIEIGPHEIPIGGNYKREVQEALKG